MDVWSWWEVRAAQYVYPRLCTLIQLTNTWDGHSYLANPHAGIDVERRIYEVFLKFGPIARIALDTLYPYDVGDPQDDIHWQKTFIYAMDQYEMQVETKIRSLNLNSFTTSEWSVDSPHGIIIIRPQANQDDPRPHCSLGFKLTLASAYIGHKVGQAVARSELQELRNMFNRFREVPHTAGSAGWIFEGVMHARLSQPTIKIHLNTIEKTTVEPGGFSMVTTGAEETFTSLAALGNMLRQKKGSHNIAVSAMGKYFHPSFSNLGAFDGLFILPSRKGSFPKGTIMLVQITIAEDHPIKISALEKLSAALPSKARSGQWIMLFVVPRGRAGFAKQRFVSVDKGSGTGGAEARRWDEKIIQMACFVSEKDIWDGAGELGIDSML